jgi:ABC-type enterochelin transport system ATPase subunit
MTRPCFSPGELARPSKGSERHRAMVLMVVHQEEDYVQVMKPDGRLVWYQDKDLIRLTDDIGETQKK